MGRGHPFPTNPKKTFYCVIPNEVRNLLLLCSWAEFEEGQSTSSIKGGDPSAMHFGVTKEGTEETPRKYSSE